MHKPKDQLNPQQPGVKVSTDHLRKRSEQAQMEKAAAQKAEVTGESNPNVQDVRLDEQGRVVDTDTPVPQQDAPPQVSQLKVDQGDIHPLLGKLEESFGIKKLKPETIVLGGYRWTFRPVKFYDYEWITSQLLADTPASLSVTNVSVGLAAINDVPCYEIFGVSTLGRHIPDPINPPSDIRFAAAEALLDWFREKTGLWEVISKLEQQSDLLMEESRSRAYPLWETLAHPLRQRVVAMQKLMQQLDQAPAGNSGEEQSHTQDSSPRTSGQENSGGTP